MIISTEAIVLHSRKYSDTSTILTLYTREHGKIGVVAKGSRRPKSKFGSAVMPLSIIDAVYYYKSSRDLHTLSGADMVLQLRQLGASYDHLSTALAVTEAVNLTQPATEKNAALYELLRSTLITLNDATSNVYSLFAFFCIHLAEIMGFMIDFRLDNDDTLSTHTSNSTDYYFSFENGAPYLAHSSNAFSGYRLAADTLNLLHEIASKSITSIHSVMLSTEQRFEIQQFFVNYFSFHLERRIVFRTEQMVMGTSTGIATGTEIRIEQQ